MELNFARTCLIGTLIFLGQSAPCLAESKYARVFEAYIRSGDGDAFARDLRAAQMRSVDFREDVAFLVGVVSSKPPGDVQSAACFELFQLAFGITGQDNPAFQDIFQPALPVFERHLTDALRDPRSLWAKTIACLTACAGLQPGSGSIPLFYQMVDSKDYTARSLALTALARLRPRPEEARKVVLSQIRSEPAIRLKLEILVFALDDNDFLNLFAGYLDSAKIEDQRAAADVLSRVGHSADPALDLLVRLRERPDLDEEVARKVDLALEHIRRTPR